MAVSLARRERLALVSAARSVGPSAPTLCGEWTVQDLLAHLIVRERRPLAAPGILVPALAGLTHRAQASTARKPFEELLTLVASPSPLFAVDLAERLVNTAEFFVHHEDILRAQASWTRRVLSPADEAQLWLVLRVMGRGLVRPAGVPVVVSDGAHTATLRGGDSPVTVRGPVSELLLFCFGRRQLEPLDFIGDPVDVAALKGASLGF